MSEPLPDYKLPSPFPSTAELTISQRKVEIRGGRLVSGPHIAKHVRYEDNSPTKRTGFGRTSKNTIALTGCGHTALAEIPLSEDGDLTDVARVCLICDGLFLSPKYGGTP